MITKSKRKPLAERLKAGLTRGRSVRQGRVDLANRGGPRSAA